MNQMRSKKGYPDYHIKLNVVKIQGLFGKIRIPLTVILSDEYQLPEFQFHFFILKSSITTHSQQGL